MKKLIRKNILKSVTLKKKLKLHTDKIRM